MNCELCQKMDAYREEKLSPDMKALVEDLSGPAKNAEILRMGILADKAIERENSLSLILPLNHVIALIESSENKAETGFITTQACIDDPIACRCSVLRHNLAT